MKEIEKMKNDVDNEIEELRAQMKSIRDRIGTLEIIKIILNGQERKKGEKND